MVQQVAINALVTVDDSQDASVLAATLRTLVGSKSAVKVLTKNAHGHMTVVPDVTPFDRSTVTHGGQEADGLAGSIARKLNTVLKTDKIVPVRKLDQDTRTWGVDYANFVSQVRELENAPEDAVAFVKDIVSQVLADQAMRGIK